jgi:PhzF family phenazine biosynthesis protein
MHTFRQVDVFGSTPLGGNPVAVVHGADGLADAQLQDFARWTNLSETTFLLAPTTDEADYRLRIFTPSTELPFAGHPTIGSAHAWLEEGGAPRSARQVVQECGAGLVTLRRTAAGAGTRLAFAAPPLLRSGPVSDDDRAAILGPLGLTEDEVVEMTWVDNGPGWVGVLLRDADAVLALQPDFYSLHHDVGVVGPRADGDTACEVRALCPMGSGITEDPVTGSLNAGLAQWLAGTVLPLSYVAAQGTVIGRTGRVHVERSTEGGGDTVWVGGDAQTVVRGEVSIA